MNIANIVLLLQLSLSLLASPKLTPTQTAFVNNAVTVAEEALAASSSTSTPAMTTDLTATALSISYINPSIVVEGNTNVLTIAGSGFQNNASVMIGGAKLTTTGNFSQNSITVNYPSLLPAGTYGVTVTNPDGGTHTLTNAFTVSAPQEISAPLVSGASEPTTTVALCPRKVFYEDTLLNQENPNGETLLLPCSLNQSSGLGSGVYLNDEGQVVTADGSLYQSEAQQTQIQPINNQAQIESQNYQAQYQVVQAKLQPLQVQFNALQAIFSNNDCSESEVGTKEVDCLLAASQEGDVGEYESAIQTDFITPVTTASVAYENTLDNLYQQIFQIRMAYHQQVAGISNSPIGLSEEQGEEQNALTVANAKITAIDQQIQIARLDYQNGTSF
jgi:IPT/TIG domain